ncbi:hypothetical protein ACKFKF_16125 [Phormidesmis sp. 146-12]
MRAKLPDDQKRQFTRSQMSFLKCSMLKENDGQASKVTICLTKLQVWATWSELSD